MKIDEKMTDEAYIILENGRVFEGRFFGAAPDCDIIGELVFTTGMTGYLETLTDKSYYGQIIVQTFPLIGNYGVIPNDFESDVVSAGAYIVRSWCQDPSNYRSEGSLDTFLRAKNITGVCGIDTRALTKIIRESGVMNGKITKVKPPQSPDLSEIRDYKVTNAVASVSVREIAHFSAVGETKYTVALMDFGMKENIKREFLARGCDVTVVPQNCTAAKIAALAPDGIILSNGPGDPAENVTVIENLREIIKLGIPIFGICLGHQLLALAAGFRTEKLKYGHRGANQPVMDAASEKVYVTSQNHGYSVVSDTIPATIAEEIFVNVNDKTCEGISYKSTSAPIFSVQFHPEACGGPRDTAFLFDKFTDNMKSHKNK